MCLPSTLPHSCPPRPHTAVRVYEKVWNFVLSLRKQSEKVRELNAHVPVRVGVKQEESMAGGSGWPPNTEPCPVVSEHGAFPKGGARQSGPPINALTWAASAKNDFPHGEASGDTRQMWHQPLAVYRQQEMTVTPAIGHSPCASGNALGTALSRLIFPAFLWKHSYRHCTDEDFNIRKTE